MPIPSVTLNNGVRMPILGLGVYQIPRDQTEQAVRWAFDAGYRHVDTASFYGNEKEVGNAVRSSGLPREDIFITTKLWPTDFLRAEAAFYASLNKLGLDYVDLYLLHWPSPIGKNRAWRVLEKLYKEGRIKAIGVSNFSIKQLDTHVQIHEITPAVNQVEFHPFLYRKELLESCRLHRIQLEAYSPLTRGERLNHPVIKQMAERYGKSPAQLLIRWCIQHDVVVIPKSSHQERMKQNAQVFDFEIAPDDMRVLDALG